MVKKEETVEEMDIDDPTQLELIAQKKRMEKIESQKLQNVERLKRKIQKQFRKHALINEADRGIPSKLPRHLNSGKRGIGSNDWR